MATQIKETSERGRLVSDTQIDTAPSLDQSKPDSVRPLVLKALEDAANDREKARDLLVERVINDRDMFKQHFLRIVQTWASDQIGSYYSEQRKKIVTLAEQPAQQKERMQSAMRNEQTRLMDQLLYGGKRLADSTPAEVRESAEKNAGLSKTYARQAKWQLAVAEAAEKNGPAEEPIRQTLTEATLNKLWETIDG